MPAARIAPQDCLYIFVVLLIIACCPACVESNLRYVACGKLRVKIACSASIRAYAEVAPAVCLRVPSREREAVSYGLIVYRHHVHLLQVGRIYAVGIIYGVAVVGASNLIASYLPTSTTETTEGLPSGTIGRIRLGQRGFRRAAVRGVGSSASSIMGK